MPLYEPKGYSPNRPSELRLKLPDTTCEVWGPGSLEGDIDEDVRAASNIIEIVPGQEEPRETMNPVTFQYTLFKRWLLHPKTKWDLTWLQDSGRVEDGEPVMEEVEMPKTTATIMGKDGKGLSKEHRTYLMGELSKFFYPEMFGGADPNSSKSGKSGTSGTKAGSKRGSTSKDPSPEQPSPSPAS